MRERLQKLIEANTEANRTKWARKRKQTGQKVFGILSSYVPEEIIYAAGILPWHVTGSWQAACSLATVYRSARSCLYCNHVLESLLKGELDFLDGVVSDDWDQDRVRLWDVWAFLKRSSFTHILHVPISISDRSCLRFANELRLLISALESFTGSKITNESLRNAIGVYNRTRMLMARLYELRKRESPPLSGAEFLGITTAAGVIPKEEFNEELEALLTYLEGRKAPIRSLYPRIMISSDMLDNPGYIQAIEETGCLVAMDDLDRGSRNFWKMVDTDTGDPVYSLARRYLYRPACPRMVSWNEQANQIITWAKEFNIQGILDFGQLYSPPRGFRIPYLRRKLVEADIPNISLEREYCLSNLGQLKTRVGAFLEMLSA